MHYRLEGLDRRIQNSKTIYGQSEISSAKDRRTRRQKRAQVQKCQNVFWAPGQPRKQHCTR
eukprot:5465303-Pyramimonas_sp.AAC.1